MVLLALPVALGGVYATSDLCGPITVSDGRVATDIGHDDTIQALLTTCEYEYRDGTEFEETRFNWLGTTAALFFLVGVYFAASGILGLIDSRRALVVTCACVLVCLSMVVAFFA